MPHGGLSQQSLGHKPEMRLPGVRQLLMLHDIIGPDRCDPSLPYLSEHTHSISATTNSTAENGFPSLLRRAPESGLGTLRLGQRDSTVWSNEPPKTPWTDPTVAVNFKAPNSFQDSSQNLSQPPPRKEALLSARSHQFSPARTSRPLYLSLRSSYTNGSVGVGNIDRRYSEYFDMDSRLQRPVCEKLSHDAPNHRDWGKTKRGRPRKRLAQACIDCRRKKIRCRPIPNTTKCTQCQKSRLNCSFESRCVI